MFGIAELKEFKNLIVKQATSTEKVSVQIRELIQAIRELTEMMKAYVRKG